MLACPGSPNRTRFAVVALVGMIALSTRTATAEPAARRKTDSTDPFGYVRADRMNMPHGAYRVAYARMIPSFSRQTKLACSACHYGFPELTPFGRLFKLNGYTLTALPTIVAGDSVRQTLELAPIPPASAMIVTSLTHLKTALPGAQNDATAFPEQLSVFLGGQVTPKIGAFTQLTYAADAGSIGIDNTEIRFADHATVGGRQVIYGLTLNNNPSMQDLWNTTPAWGFPFVTSSVAPSPAAAMQVEGAFAQQVVGLGAYAMWDQTLYAEVTTYRSAQQGVAGPPGPTSVNANRGVIPYWRLAVQRTFGPNYLMVGTYGLDATLYPAGVSQFTNRFTDVGVDAQYERRLGTGALIARTTYLHERQSLTGSIETAAGAPVPNPTDALNEFRINASYLPTTRFTFTAGYFTTTGTRDTALFAPAAVTGSAHGSPSSSGTIGEIDFNAWLNTRVGAQYIRYDKFNGASLAYDGVGRNASGNNTVYVFLWVAF
jgi:hypothetical protein